MKKLRPIISFTFYLAIAILVGITVTYAGNLTPPGAPAKTMYTFGDLHTLITTGETEASADFATPGSVSATFYSISDLVTAFNDMLKNNVSGADGSKTFNIPDGYYFGKTATANDTDLTEANIADGIDILGVTGTGLIAQGDAGASDVLASKTFSTSTASNVTGTMVNNGAVTITPSTTDQTIAAGYHNGSGVVSGDADLIAANIKSGTTIFDVPGSLVAGNTYSASPLKTGQTICYDDVGTVIDCAGTGQDGEYLEGVTSSYTNNGDGTVTNTATGLMWKRCPEGLSGANCETGTVATMNWLTALATCEADTTASQTDWRLPNIAELSSVVDFNRTYPAINITAFPATPASYFWSSTSYPIGGFTAAWQIYFSAGYTAGSAKTALYRVRCVRSI